MNLGKNKLLLDEARSRRLVISSWDAHEAVQYAEALVTVIRRPEHTESTAEQRALTLAMIISYARPFSGNRGSQDTDHSQPDEFIATLTTEERKWHDRVVSLRNQAFAHSDAEVARVNLGGAEVELPMPSMKDPRVTFTVEEAEDVLALSRKLHAWHDAELQGRGAFGVTLFRHGTAA